MNLIEAKTVITDEGYSADRLVDSSGEHLGKYARGYHAVCLGHPQCSPARLGALTDKLHSIDGFESLTLLINFMNESFPVHKVEKHPTKWVIPFR